MIYLPSIQGHLTIATLKTPNSVTPISCVTHPSHVRREKGFQNETSDEEKCLPTKFAEVLLIEEEKEGQKSFAQAIEKNARRSIPFEDAREERRYIEANGNIGRARVKK